MKTMRYAALVAAITLAAGCTFGPAGDGGSEPGELRILGGSELADLEPIFERAKRDIDLTVRVDHIGTLDGVQQVIDGKADGRYDAIWFSSNRYLALRPEAQGKIGTSTKIMSSPVVLGLRASVAKRLGWDKRRVSWSEIAEVVGSGAFTYGMTSPAASNSGFSALVAVAAALSGTGSALDAATIERVSPRMRSFFAGQTLTAGSSGWLSQSYGRRGGEVDGLINYESELLALNASGRGRELLTPIYPSDGVITADYPLTLLQSAPERARDDYRRLVEYLRRPEIQRAIVAQTHRRPVVQMPTRLPAAPPELPFPARIDAVDALIAAYFDKIRRPSRTVYVLDTSGSMRGGRIASLKAALTALTGADTTISGRFQRFHNREEITLLPFASAPRPPRSFTVPEVGQGAVLGEIRAAAEQLPAAGQTAVYDSLRRGFEILQGRSAGDPDRFTSIVLMTDGENNRGASLEGFRSWYQDQPASIRRVPVFPILFGEAAAGEMNELAGFTGGRTFDGRSQSLAAVFKEIRGYQ
jgi:Ca-activated chloride channel family protein